MIDWYPSLKLIFKLIFKLIKKMRPYIHLLILFIITMTSMVSCNATSTEPHAISNYYEAKKLFWSKIYGDGGETLYCGQSFVKKHKKINVEHVFPMSWVMNELNCQDRTLCRNKSAKFNQIEADLHNLYPSRRDINQARGSFPFGMVRGEKRKHGKCDFEIDFNSRKIEPRPSVRGNIARAMFYMHDQYQLPLHTRLGKLLKEWNRSDVPDQHEIKRNDVIEKLQGNRNKYIDNYRDADKIYF